MGLDITLAYHTNFADAMARSEQAEKLINAVWEEGLSETDRDVKIAAIAAGYGTDEYGGIKTDGYEVPKSLIDPAHMFTLGYFRSSYNSGGINSVMGKLGLPGLYEIFGVVDSDDEYYLTIDWEQARARAADAVDKYAAFLESPAGRFGVTEVRPMFEYGVNDEKEALDMFMRELGEQRGAFGGNFSNRDGEFFLEGQKVYAVITKNFKRDLSGNPLANYLNRPAVFVVHDRYKEEGKQDWYLTALQIVLESIEYVLSRPDPQNYRLRWSA